MKPKYSGCVYAVDVNFDSVVVGENACKDISITNYGNIPFILNKDFHVKDDLPFSVDTISTPLPMTVLPGSFVTVRVCFHPPPFATYLSEINWSTDIDASVIDVMKHT